MNCREAQDMIHPYVDGELDLAKALDVETHLRDCSACTAAHRNIVALCSSVAAGSLYFRAPAGLEQRVRSNLPQPTAVTRRIGIRNWVAAAAAIVLIAATTWLLTQRSGGGAERLLVAEVTSAHVRSLMADHLWDVQSTDQHTVKPWFDGKLDFAPDVRNFSNESFALEGGRLDYLAGRPVAALVYRHDKHYINVFVWPAAGPSEQSEVAATQQGFALLHWIHAGMNYWAISDTSPDALRRFAGLVRQGALPASQGGE